MKRPSALTGDDVRSTRLAMHLSRARFADLIGVSLSTMHRWESLGSARARMEPLPARLLHLIRAQLADGDVVRRVRFVEDVTVALDVHGGLGGLHRLLAWVYEGVGREHRAGHADLSS